MSSTAYNASTKDQILGLHNCLCKKATVFHHNANTTKLYILKFTNKSANTATYNLMYLE